jgi:hypothetical protein
VDDAEWDDPLSLHNRLGEMAPMPWSYDPGDPTDRIIDARGDVVCRLRSSGPRDAICVAAILAGMDVIAMSAPAKRSN